MPKLKEEYNFLFRSLFNESTIHRLIIEKLSTSSMGKTRQELLKSSGIPAGGDVTTALKNLCDCDFLREYSAPMKRERDKIYQLTDLFTLFYLSNVKNYHGRDTHHWCNMIDAPSHRAWSGYAFEQVCLNHLPQIKHKLGISGIQADAYAWHGKTSQIDLVIDRRDQVVNLCEMKYATGLFEIDKKYDALLHSRMEQFRTETKNKKGLYLTMVTTYGLIDNEYRGNIQNEITIDDLFTDFR